jgi:hypothetical protein
LTFKKAYETLSLTETIKDGQSPKGVKNMTDYRSLVDTEVGRAVDVHLADRSYSLNPYKEAYLYHRPANPGEAISPLVISDVSPDGYELSDGRRLFGNRNQMFNLIREIAYRLPILG